MADFLKKDRPIILLDVDGPVADLHEAWIKLHNRDTGDTMKAEDVTAWDISRFVGKGIPRDSIYDQLKRHDLYDYVKPTLGAVSGVRLLRELGHVIYLTSSTPETAIPKIEWLKKYGFLVNPGHRSTPEVMTGYNKQMVYGDVFIDDRAENLLEHWFAEKILFAMPHNVDDREPLGESVAYAWSQVVSKTREAVARKESAQWRRLAGLTNVAY